MRSLTCACGQGPFDNDETLKHHKRSCPIEQQKKRDAKNASLPPIVPPWHADVPSPNPDPMKPGSQQPSLTTLVATSESKDGKDDTRLEKCPICNYSAPTHKGQAIHNGKCKAKQFKVPANAPNAPPGNHSPLGVPGSSTNETGARLEGRDGKANAARKKNIFPLFGHEIIKGLPSCVQSLNLTYEKGTKEKVTKITVVLVENDEENETTPSNDS